MEKITPIIVVSRCLGFEPCRYDGQMYKDPFVEELKEFVKILTICPEMEIGMGVPRDTIRIVNLEDGVRLIQISTGQDFHKDMNLYIEKMFNSLNDIDGFILKSKSPSCGIQDVKIYHGMQKSAHSTKGSGLVGGAIRDRFTNLAVEDEGRLKNYRIREHF